MVEEETQFGGEQELAMTPELPTLRSPHTDPHKVRAVHDGKAGVTSLSLVPGGGSRARRVTWEGHAMQGTQASGSEWDWMRSKSPSSSEIPPEKISAVLTSKHLLLSPQGSCAKCGPSWARPRPS